MLVRTYSSDLVSEMLLSTRSSSNSPPPVDDKLMTSRSSLALWEDLDGSYELDGRFEVKVESV